MKKIEYTGGFALLEQLDSDGRDADSNDEDFRVKNVYLQNVSSF